MSKTVNECVKFSENLTDEEYHKIFNDFMNLNGYITKCVSNNKVIGYLVRCEVQGFPNLVSMHYEPINDINNYSRKQKLVKAIAMSRAIKGGQRALTNYIKTHQLSEFKSESFTNIFDSPENLNENAKKIYENKKFNYTEFYKYVKSFENKVKKYYKNKEIKIVWLPI